MGNKLFPLPLFIQLLQKNPVCIGYSVATGVVCLIPAIVFYSLWQDLRNEKKFWLWRLKKEEKKEENKKSNLKLPTEAYVTIFEEIERELSKKEKE